MTTLGEQKPVLHLKRRVQCSLNVPVRDPEWQVTVKPGLGEADGSNDTEARSLMGARENRLLGQV